MVPESRILETKHLNTPRLVADDTQTTVWKWEQQEPFGVNAANDDPDGNAVAFEFNLRFPGQYFDKETGLHYNYFRDYDPTSGRYVESDRIGIAGGLNTYLYAYGVPMEFSDPSGLKTFSVGGRGSFFYGGAGGTVSISVGISTSWQLCFQIQTCSRLGAGASIGIGATATVGNAPFCEGTSLGIGGFTNLGLGRTFGAVSSNTTLNGTSVSGTFGGGAGYSAGTQVCITETFCRFP